VRNDAAVRTRFGDDHRRFVSFSFRLMSNEYIIRLRKKEIEPIDRIRKEGNIFSTFLSFFFKQTLEQVS
jgi:hypothetical protein